ncbi:MAG: transglutaminase domain-containing protein [Candidatus Neomarinimicrobiota bacterium]
MRRNITRLGGLLLAGLFLIIWSDCAGNEYRTLIEKGEFSIAEKIVKRKLCRNKSLSAIEKRQLEFELERMNRIRLDFDRSEAEVIEYIKKYIPEVTKSDLNRWESENSLEYMLIDGQKMYFGAAAPNLFRLDKAAKAIKQKADSLKSAGTEEEVGLDLDAHCRKVIDAVANTRKNTVLPVRMKIVQSVAVNPNVVPDGKIIRCWIPFPREITNRQINIKISKTDPPNYILANTDQTLQRTIYFEKPAVNDSTIRFSVEYTYEVFGSYTAIVAENVMAVAPTPELQPFLQEEPPHIVFTDEMRQLSHQIVGSEANPYRIAQKLFEWIDTNVPWASAREYSTFYNIPHYVVNNLHGDCGMMTLTFITLCRMNGIPARWQSGWEFQPPSNSMHDWGEIYFAPYGWVPMDVTYGLRKTDDEPLKWFYLNGMDSYRLIFNDGISADFYPAKIYPRSETVDSQRGEVEWEGGNLYYDKWDWGFEWEVLSAH